MLYILTAEEMNALVPRIELLAMAERADKAELLCEAYKEAGQAFLPAVANQSFEEFTAELYRQKMAEYEARSGG